MTDLPNHQARLKIVQAGEPVLRQLATQLKPGDIRTPEIQRLIDWMRQTMYDAPGVGLAAPQVGVPLQLAVIEDKPEYTRDASAAFLSERERQPVPFQVVINPKLTLRADGEAEFFEGCLSVAGFTAVVPRALRVTVDCLDHNAKPKKIEAQGWYARILQHEIDHLHGALYLDRMRTRTFMTMENYNRHWKEKPVAEALQLLARS